MILNYHIHVESISIFENMYFLAKNLECNERIHLPFITNYYQ